MIDIPDIKTEKYINAASCWPLEGQIILAQYDNEGIWVYQAFNPEIAEYAVKNQRFVGCANYNICRMSWIKTNFLWMQYRSGWCSKTQQERCLAIKLRRDFFDYIVRNAVDSQRSSKTDIQSSDIRLQWDPDHFPNGQKCARRAIQLGLRGKELMKMASGEVVLSIIDLTDFVITQRNNSSEISKWTDLLIPIERPYPMNPILEEM